MRPIAKPKTVINTAAYCAMFILKMAKMLRKFYFKVATLLFLEAKILITKTTT